MNHTDPTADARVAEARRAVHESLILLPAWEADRVRSLIADLETAVEFRAASAVVSPPPSRAALRDRIRRAVCEAEGFAWDTDMLEPDEYGEVADAVLAVLGDQRATIESAAYRAAANYVRGHSADERYGRANISTALCMVADELFRWAAEAHANGLPLVKGNCPACRRASLFLGTGGYPTCSNYECPEPDAATTVLEQYANEAHPPRHSWRVETRHPLADEWAPGSHFGDRQAAVERYETANSRAPLWKDRTPVERRIVRETTTYTVEEPAPVAQQPTPECIASISGSCYREMQGEGPCDTEGGECVYGGRPAGEQQQTDTKARPRRGDQFEAWLKQQRDNYRPRSSAWNELDYLLDQYRLHADTGTPLTEHVCEGQTVGDCERLEPAPVAQQPEAEARPWHRTAGFDQHDDYREDVPAPVPPGCWYNAAAAEEAMRDEPLDEPGPAVQQPAACGDPQHRHIGPCHVYASPASGGTEQQPAAADGEETPRCGCGHKRSIHTGSNLFCAVPNCMCSHYTGPCTT
ncbi:hypothetical protein AB0N77_09655 [Streptomyces misionensis]|uniref:hypothetical protein n=1 Tax=Streptomyces misionensis TaxID=67331 RepID=UPI0034409A5D